MISAIRYHDISCGHRVFGHESKCAHLHGHNYRFHFLCTAKELDYVGRVLDFSAIKERLCMWLEDNWDHKFLVWQEDPFARELTLLDSSVVTLTFNPTAELMADHLLRIVAPVQLKGTGVMCMSVKVEETRKCSAMAVGDYEYLKDTYELVEKASGIPEGG